jgi:hypothetical protein
MMTDNTITNQCADPTQTLTVEIPCALAARVERYAKETGSTVTGVLIEALDTFLRKADE